MTVTKKGYQIDLVSVEWRLTALNMDPEHTGQGLPVSGQRVSLSERVHVGVGGDWMRVGELIAFLTWLHAGCLSKVSVCVYLETKALCPTADLNPLSPATYLTNALTYKYRRRGQKGPGAIGHGGGRGCIFREGPSSCHLTHVATWFWGHRQHCLI